MLHSFKLTIAKVLFYTLGYLPLPVLHAIGSTLGMLLYVLPIRLRYYASTNLKLCFPRLSWMQHQWRLFCSLRELGKGLLEAPVFWVRNQQHLLRLVDNKEALAPVSEIKAGGQGAIILGIHLGGFYLKNAVIAHDLPGTTYLYRPQKGMLGLLMHLLRNRFGGNLVSTSRQGVLSLFRHLKQGGVVGMLCDHNVLDHGNVFAPFFGIKVPTMTLPARLAVKTRIPVFMAIMQRLSWGRGFKLHLWQVDDAIYSADLDDAAMAMNAEVEKAIQMFPTQHEWFYRRFWDRPPGAQPLYKTKIKQ